MRLRRTPQGRCSAIPGADAIDAAVFDLKAVNPCARGGQDSRSPESFPATIAGHQRTFDTALARLGHLLAEPGLVGIARGDDPTDHLRREATDEQYPGPSGAH